MEQQDNQNPQAEEPRKKGRGTWIAAICVAASLLLGGVGFYYYTTLQDAESEESAYNLLEDNYTPEDYEAYLQNYPEGPHAKEVEARLTKLRTMIGQWALISNSSRAGDFIDFKNRYADPQYTRLCEIKIDSLDWVTASTTATPEAYALYLSQHPDGRYASEASVAQGKMQELEISPADRSMLMQVCTDFFRGIESQDEATICSNITPTMRRFLSKQNTTKAEVVNLIKGMFNEHIQNCRFIVNRDFNISKVPGSETGFIYRAEFSVDQHIERDNDGKTLGSYRAIVELNSDLLIESLTLEEVSKN